MKLRDFYSTFILIALLLITGAAIQHFTDAQILWNSYVAMVFFYGVIFFIGVYAAKLRKSDTVSDVILAGRDMPLWIAVFTMCATWLGGGYVNGTAEYTANDAYGLMWLQAPWGYALSLMLGGIFFARKMRFYKFNTMIDPLEQRFGKKMAAVLFIPALTGEIFWTAAILTALGTTFSTVLDIDFTTSIIISSVVAIAYTATGGLWAVALTDVVQLCLLFIGLMVVVPFALDYVGGWNSVWSAYQTKMGDLASFIPKHSVLGNSYWNWWDSALLLVFGGIPWHSYFQRVLAAKSDKIAVNLSILSGIICLFAAIPPLMIGVIGDSIPSWQAIGAKAEPTDALILPYVIRYLTPPIVATIGLGAVAAAVMSSVDSSILSASSMASWNVFRPLVKPNISNNGLVKVIKTCVWIIGIAATLIALQVKSVYILWFLCSDFVFCLLFPQLVLALFDKKANLYGSIAGLIVGFLLRFGGGEPALGIPRFIEYPMIENDVIMFPFRSLAAFSSLAVIMIVSRLTQKQCPPQALYDMSKPV